MLFFLRCSSKRACLSALMLRFATTYAPAPAAGHDWSDVCISFQVWAVTILVYLPTQSEPQPSLPRQYHQPKILPAPFMGAVAHQKDLTCFGDSVSAHP